MIDTGRQFDEQTMALLRATIGSTLHGFCAYCPFDERNVYALARLDFGDHALDLSNRHEPIVLGADYTLEQVAVMNVAPASGEPIWHPANRELSQVALSIDIDDCLVVVDTMLLSKGSRRLNKLVLVQAVVFETHDENGNVELVSFDRDIWSDEYMNVVRGSKISEVTRDHRADYIAEPPYSYQFGRNVIRLSQPH